MLYKCSNVSKFESALAVKNTLGENAHMQTNIVLCGEEEKFINEVSGSFFRKASTSTSMMDFFSSPQNTTFACVHFYLVCS